MADLSAVTRQNAVYWEAIAAHRLGEPVEFFLSGRRALMDEDLAVIGDPAGKRVLQLDSAVGNEAITFAQLGATVTAVDISPTHVANGRAKAAAVGVNVNFTVADMMELPADVDGFDVIYISWGGLCWVPALHLRPRSAEQSRSGERADGYVHESARPPVCPVQRYRCQWACRGRSQSRAARSMRRRRHDRRECP
ncbi:MAG TPA: class I SAM-dependent methyltransferase [Streptosporangiaceae bacterium]|nr:class I SAM-dependent methyltransferase [Streptosporangiaceae bacterium]